ncbi:hypothetical protein BK120_27535 [Paenibacillus sp. FSL A5-0031]|uniref:hypothetical protein n=1 Tax=Paenibacillus sp. FSL A5-0031 TaxID=1920420 RepID=UPI00096F158D|nr:hypothetical protein [Paenibacillus sp. FSL A5-0031]OME76901.1 hypothetical protein BK120_27535 [Paenibacillus sp. FSL A5-0031]
MDEVITEIKSPSGFYKVQLIKRSKDGLYTSKTFMWLEHDVEISEILGEDGYWGVLHSSTPISDSVNRCLIIAAEQLYAASGEKITM